MQAAEHPTGETDRVRALHALQILDTIEEERFDRITRIAARLFDVPVVLVSLVDSHRQWFKSHHGTDTCETSRDVSFCAHAILGNEAMVVHDALADERFRDNPLVTGEPNIRFYAGQPLRAPGGANIGSFCIIDRQPREFSDADRALLADLAALVERELALLLEATQDPLTGLYNRRGLNDVAQHVIALCARSGSRATVATIDLDNFKQINDRHGHEEGDRVLQWFARTLLKHFRRSDVIARLGGDEFCILAPLIAADGLRASVARVTTAYQQSDLAARHPDFSWSVGIREIRCEPDTQLDEVLRLADQQMYLDKQARQQKPARPSGKRG